MNQHTPIATDQPEEWRKVASANDGYEVSNLGRVRNAKTLHVLIPQDLRGYCRVTFQKKGHLVHRLVAEAFIGIPSSYREVNRLDGNKKNNWHQNLCWCTPKENSQHAIVTGLKTYHSIRGDRHYGRKLSEAGVRQIRRWKHTGIALSEFADAFGVSLSAIQKASSGEKWSHVS